MESVHKNLPCISATLLIDKDQADQHLKYLEYANQNVFLRFFYHSDDPRKNGDKGRKLNYLRWQEIEAYQQDGRGVYVVVNGASGGHEDKEIKQCVAIFCEWDDRPVEEQLLHWQTVGFLEPTFTVYSGDKSAQPYWIFDQPINVEQWRELQRLLIEVMGADPSNKNPSRVFRLAGGWHIKPGREPRQSTIVQDSGKKYSYKQVKQELLRLKSGLMVNVEQQKDSIELLHQHQHAGSMLLSQYQRYQDIQIPVIASIPLEVCLAKGSRKLLDSGMSKGSRNASGAKLARDLIGTANYLQSIRQRFDGDPRRLLDDYANRCTPTLEAPETDAIWKSALKDNPTPSCQPEGVEACIRAWYWKDYLKPEQSPSSNHWASRGFDNSNNSGNKPPIATVALCDRIREILNRYESESETASALMDLAAVTGRNYNEINSLAKIIRAEGELATEVIEAVQSFQGILTSCRKRLDIRRYLENTLSDLLIAVSSAMPTASEYLFNTLLASSASRIGTAARVTINPEGGYTQPCIFWTANVAHSGQAKTPPQQVILRSLEDMEAAAKQIHDVEMEDYEADKDSDRKPPVRQRRLLNNVTTSTKIRIHDENPRGLLEYIDELVADYQRLNQYKSGKGDDLQLELSFWNGSGSNFDRHDARLFLARTGFSKTGTYQWDTLARLMSDEINFIASGYSSRFLYCSISDAPARYLNLLSSPNPSANKLQAKLYWLYGELEKLPEANYLLSHEAKVLFQGWNHTLINAEMEEKHFGLSLVYAKIESYTARIALWLHIVNAVLRKEEPLPVISGETMQYAIEIASFYLDQHKLIHAHNAPNRQPEGIFLKVQTTAEKVLKKSGKGVSASFLKSRINALKSWAVEKIRACIFKALATSGHGQIQGEGSEMVYIPKPPTEDAPAELVGVGRELVESPTIETSPSLALQASIDEIGEDTRVQRCPPLSEVCGDAIAPANYSQPPVEALASPDERQFTNSVAENITATNLDLVGNTINSSPITPTEQAQLTAATTRKLAEQILLCSTWVEIAQQVEENGNALRAAAREMTATQRQEVVRLLSEHLCQSPSHVLQLAWIPEKLRQRVIEKLRFTVGRIAANLTDSVSDATWELISGCRLEIPKVIGTQQLWDFTTPDGNKFHAYPSAIQVIAYCEDTGKLPATNPQRESSGGLQGG